MKSLSVAAFVFTLLLLTTTSNAQAPPRDLEGHYHNSMVELSWNHPESEVQPTSYKLYRRGAEVGDFTLLASLSGNGYEDSAIVQNRLYKYKVTAVYEGGIESLPSKIAVVFTGFLPAPPPRELEGEFQNGHVELGWHRPESDRDPSFYKIYRHSEHDSTIVAIGQTAEKWFIDESVKLLARYFYGVTAIYADGAQSGPSNIVMVFTEPDSTEDDSADVKIHFTTEPPHVAFVGQPFHYDPDVVTLPKDVPVCFTLEHGPDGMTINPSTGEIDWTPASAGIVEVEIEARPCDGREGDEEQEFRLMVLTGEPGSVHGIVLNDEGAGIHGVKIKLFDVSQGLFIMGTHTDSIGGYEFPFVNPATYYVRAKPEHNSYLPQWYDGASEISAATPVVVTSGNSSKVDFTLHRRDTLKNDLMLSGAVRDTAGSPIAGARVLVFRVNCQGDEDGDWDDHHGDRHLVRIAETDDNGNYKVFLREGTYIAGAKAHGYLPQFWDHKASPLEADQIVVAGTVSGINFDLSPRPVGTGSIAGTIRSAQDSTALEAHVLGFHKNSSGQFTGFVAFGETDSAGQYVLDQLPDGSYLVLAKVHDDFHPTFYDLNGGTPFADSADLVAVTGGAVAGIDIYAVADSVDGLNSLRGLVLAGSTSIERTVSAGNPLAGAIVTVANAAGNVVSSAISQTNGSYFAAGLAPGSYVVTFQKPGMSTVSLPITVTYVNNSPATITVDAQMINAGSGQVGIFGVRSAWNLLSVPVAVEDMQRVSIFPGAVSDAFSYSSEAGYQANSLLEYGNGYWVKFPSAAILALAGEERASQSIQVKSGWNLVGSLSTPIALSAVSTQPAGILSSNFYGYDGGYFVAPMLTPSRGYWVKSSADGMLAMSSSAPGAKATSAQPDDLNGLNSLEFTDGAGNKQLLYFGNSNSVSLKKYDMPPIAPEGSFDVRFASQRMVELHPAGVTSVTEYPIRLRGTSGAVTLKWSVKNQIRYMLADPTGKPIMSNALTGTGKVTLGRNVAGTLILSAQPGSLPSRFALAQNYPNPFNPNTRIDFELPVQGIVTLKVYNLLGQELAVLLDNAALPAGQQSVRFDAASFGSGVYFYRLQVNGASDGEQKFVEVRKMILMK